MSMAAIGVFSMSFFIEHDSEEVGHVVRMIFTAALGIPVMLSAALVSRLMHNRGWAALLPHVLGLAVLMLFYLTFEVGRYNSPTNGSILVFFLLNIAAHLLVSVVAWVGRGDESSFWEYNRTLFVTFLTGASYSVILFTGLGVAIAATNELFELKINGSIYGHLFFLIAGIFNTSYFLANFPEERVAEGRFEVQEFAPLHILVKYILIPIVSLYVVILYAYSLKILFQWELPRGWVASLVLGFSVAGIFTWLLNYQVRRFEESSFMEAFHVWYFRLLLPMTLLLFVAIGKRIGDYGVTEMRYVVATTGVWLLVTCVYFIFSRSADIRFIPLSLILVALLMAVGPFSARNVSTRSQVHELERLLLEAGMLHDGKMVPLAVTLQSETANRIRNVLDYMYDWKKLDAVAHLHDSIPPDGNMEVTAYRNLLTSLHLPSATYPELTSEYCSYNFEAPTFFTTKGPTTVYLLDLSISNDSHDTILYFIGDTILLGENSGQGWKLPLRPMVDSLKNKHGCSPVNILPASAGQWEWNFDSLRFKLLLRNLNIRQMDNDSIPILEYANGFLLLERVEQ